MKINPWQFVRSLAPAIGVLAASTLLHAASGDENWDNRFGITAPTYLLSGNTRMPGWINVIAADGTNTYVGGYFTDIGGIAASNIARWDGRQWHALGSGLSDAVNAIAVNNGVLYAGGTFTGAGALTVNGVASWDGTNWSALGGGMSVSGSQGSAVNALAFYGGSLYAGGAFSTADGHTANGFARWDGAAWNSYVTFQSFAFTNIGVGIVNAMIVLNGQLYIGGSFHTLVGNGSSSFTITNLAAFNGGAFASVGSSPASSAYQFGSAQSDIFTLATDGAHIFAGGYFDHAGSLLVTNVAEWDGAAWSALGSGSSSPVGAIAFAGGQLYANSPAGLMQWTGSQWVTNGVFASGSFAHPRGAIVPDGNGGLLAAGSFGNVNGAAISGLARYANGQWTALGLGLNLGDGGGYGEAVATDGTNVYIGGRFWSGGGISGTNIIWWDGTNYHSIGNASSDVYTLALWNGSLYAGGDFTSINGVPANHVARWDGTNWFALGGGTGSDVYALLATGANFYVGGNFRSVGGSITAHGIARWDGSNWQNVGPAQSLYYGTVYALAFYNSNLIAGGNFGFNAPGNSVAQWNGTSWSGLGSGVSSGSGYKVYALSVYGTDLIVGGFFVAAGGQAATNLASWNGSAWSSPGNVTGADSGNGGRNVLCLASLNGSLFAGGEFTNINGVAASGIAKWDGSTWSALGSGLGAGNSFASALAGVSADLFVLGNFISAGANPSAGIAVWHTASTAGITPTITATTSGNQLLLSWPSSATNYTLEASTNLDAGALWAPLTSGIVTNGGNLVLTNSMTGSAAFFRLHQQ